MDRTAPHSAHTDDPASNQEDRSGPAMPACIAAILSMVRSLLGYGKHLDATLPEHAENPRFPVLAAGFGTHDLRRILAHVQRGILRAMMLQKYLLARAAQGRDIAPIVGRFNAGSPSVRLGTGSCHRTVVTPRTYGGLSGLAASMPPRSRPHRV